MGASPALTHGLCTLTLHTVLTNVVTSLLAYSHCKITNERGQGKLYTVGTQLTGKKRRKLLYCNTQT